MMYSTREISLDAMQKLAGNKGKHTEGQRMETSGSAWECDWVVGLQILTRGDKPGSGMETVQKQKGGKNGLCMETLDPIQEPD